MTEIDYTCTKCQRTHILDFFDRETWTCYNCRDTQYPCHYCQHPCYLNVSEKETWGCDHCNVLFYITGNDVITKLYCLYNNIQHVIYLNYNKGFSQIDIEDDKGFGSFQHILKVNHIINVNPTNIKSKLKTYLTFL